MSEKQKNHQTGWFICLGIVLCATEVLSQGCSITDNPGQLISIYDVSLSTATEVVETFNIENAVEINDAFNEDMKEEYIGATLIDQMLVIHKTDKFANYAENESQTSINFKMQFMCRSGNTQGLSAYYTFTIYLLATNDNAPTFPQTEYNMKIPLPLPANFEITFYGEIFARDIDLGDNRVTFAGGNNYFSVGTIGRSTTSPKEYFMSIKSARQILLLPSDAASFQVTATDSGGLSGQSTIRLEVDPENSYSRDPSPTFEKTSYRFKIDENGNYANEFCYITEETFEASEIQFRLAGQDASHFVMDVDGRQVNVLFSGSIDQDEFKEKTLLTVDLLATREGYDTGHATILVDLPVVCETETTTPKPCEITNCPDADGPVFSQKLYTFRIFKGAVGVIGHVEATLDDPVLLPTLRYRVNYNDAPAWLMDVVKVDEISGAITIAELTTTESTFNIEIIATVEDESVTKVGTTRIVVAIDENEVCSATPVEKSLTFVTVKEEQRNTDIFPTKIGDCDYELLSFLPNDKDYIFLDENQKLSTIQIDRESEIFGDMTVAQIQIKLKLVCPKEDLLKQRKKRALEDFVDNVFTDEIHFNSDVTQINLFIEDINDNKPVFEIPSTSVSSIGYPNADLVGLLLPPYLIQVKANDADLGVNAQIEYSLNVNENFAIDPKSGVIFPLTTEMRDEVLTLVVSATDSVHITNTQIRVHKLTLDHLIVVYVDDYGYHEMETVTKNLENELGADKVSLKVLRHGNVPVNNVKRWISTRSTSGTNLKLVTYAFDENNVLISAEELLKKFRDIEGTASFSLTSITLEEEIKSEIPEPTEPEEENNSTYLAVTITLSVLVVLLLGAGFIGWWFWIRPTEWKHIEETTSVDNIAVGKSENNINTEEMTEKERPSLNINGSTWTESNDSPQIIKNITTIEDGEPTSSISALAVQLAAATVSESTPTPRERKKSITFNENVERIEIETEVPVTVNTYQF